MVYNQSLEDYLESILLLSKSGDVVHRVDIARKMNVSQPAVQKAIKILQRNAYVDLDGLHVYLTKKGEDYAKQIFDRHCTIARFLQKLGVSPDEAESDACKMEHVISLQTFEAIKEFLGE